MALMYPMALAAASLGMTACSGDDPAPVGSRAATSAPSPSVPPVGPLVVFLGDSLTAGYGLAEDEAYPAVVAERLRADGIPVRVVNAGVSGDTTAGGVRRTDWLLGQKPDVLVVGLGGNDALRGQPVEEVERNLRAIVAKAKAAGVRVLLLGMKIPPNYGADYASRFESIYPSVARSTGTALVPFLLEGVGGRSEMNQVDGLHPNARGQVRVAENVLPELRKLLR